MRQAYFVFGVFGKIKDGQSWCHLQILAALIANLFSKKSFIQWNVFFLHNERDGVTWYTCHDKRLGKGVWSVAGQPSRSFVQVRQKWELRSGSLRQKSYRQSLPHSMCAGFYSLYVDLPRGYFGWPTGHKSNKSRDRASEKTIGHFKIKCVNDRWPTRNLIPAYACSNTHTHTHSGIRFRVGHRSLTHLILKWPIVFSVSRSLDLLFSWPLGQPK